MAERLSFCGNEMAYASMLSAEHVSRYALLRSLCAGRRVLDIACGEGYGSALMRTWGAIDVVGVDISKEAVANAARAFGGDGIRFIQGDASSSGELRNQLGTFDLIVSFETLEHVQDAEGLLEGIKTLSTDGGSIVISCPNDAAVLNGGSNHFHARTYTFEEFRQTVTRVLGEPSDWMLGTSVLGFGAFASESNLLNAPPPSLMGLMQGVDVPVAVALPAQDGHEVNRASCAYYVAGWNCELPQAAVVAPISFQVYESPWNNWMASKAEVERLNNVLEGLVAQHSQQGREMQQLQVSTGVEIERLVRAVREAREQQAESEQEARRLRTASQIAIARIHDDIAAQAASAETRQAEMREALLSLQRLNQEMCGGLQAEERKRGELEARLGEEERKCRERDARLQEIEGSRWHRVGKSYYSLYSRPGVGRVLTGLRKLVGALP